MWRGGPRDVLGMSQYGKVIKCGEDRAKRSFRRVALAVWG